MIIHKFSKNAMKTIKNFMLVAFAATAVVACQKEMADNNDFTSAGNVVTFSGSVKEAETTTKTAIYYEDAAKSFPTLFTTSDVIAVNGVKSKANVLNDEGEIVYKEAVSVSKDQTSITFDVEGVTPPYYAVTGTHYKQNYADGVYPIQVSGTGAMQKFRTVAGGEYVSFHSSSDILAAYSETESFEFKHLSTFYAITIDSEHSTVKDNIKNIYIRQGDGSNIAGQWTLKFDENHKPFLEPSSLTAFIGYDCGEEGVAQGTTMIVGLPAYNYENGLIFTIKDVNGKFASFKVDPSKTQHAADGGKIIPFKPAFNPGDGVINSAEDWNEFAAFVNNTGEKKDWEIYRWIGAGGNTITLGKDIEAEDLDPITVDFTYTLDGNGKTITRTKATAALFSTVSGTVKNLTLAGNFTATASQGDAPFVSTLAPGGTISGCTNKMTITFDKNDHTYVSGIVKIMKGGTIENCINDGAIYAKLINTSNKNVAVAGIVAQIYATGEDVIIRNCTNKKAVTFAPKVESSSYGSKACGVGGVIGWIREASSVVIDNCDNTAFVTYSSENVTSTTGSAAFAICVGGIVGVADNNIHSEGVVSTNGLNIQMTNCDNSGQVYNCSTNNSKTSTNNNKVFTGGIAGALHGTESTPVEMISCTNTGNVYGYDLYEGDVVSTRPPYCVILGGLVGFGGHLYMEECDVDCIVGNGQRPVLSTSGVIGFAVNKFHLKNCDISFEGYHRNNKNAVANKSVVATVINQYNGAALSPIVPSITGSIIEGCTFDYTMNSHTTAVSSSNNGNTASFNTTETSTELTNLVCGEGYNPANDVTLK